jgi:methylglyoxal synthase
MSDLSITPPGPEHRNTKELGDSPVRVVLLASRDHRLGPDSRLVRFVREFEFLLQQDYVHIWSTPTNLLAIRRSGLLCEKQCSLVKPGRQGGLVHLTELTIPSNGDEALTVIYLIDPRDPTSMYPESAALKRECVANRVLFLSTYMSAVEWASLESARHFPGYFAANTPSRSIDRTGECIALISHDDLKAEMMHFALRKHHDFLATFQGRMGTGTTATYLSDPEERSKLGPQLELARHGPLGTFQLDAVGSEPLVGHCRVLLPLSKRRQQELDSKIKMLKDVLKEVKLKTVAMKSGPDGGDVQIAKEVLDGKVQKVVFFEDPYTARPHEHDIQVLERACRLQGETVVCLSDPTSADRWASAWQTDGSRYQERASITILRALEQTHRQSREDGLPFRAVIAGTGGDVDQTMNSICRAAAWYVSALIERIWREDKKCQAPVKIVVPWGRTISESFLAQLAEVEEIVCGRHEGLGLFLDDELPSACETRLPPFLPRPVVQAMAMAGLTGTPNPRFEANVVAEKLACLYGELEPVTIPGSAFIAHGENAPQEVAKAIGQLIEADIVLLMGHPVITQQLKEKTSMLREIYQTAVNGRAIGELCGIFIDSSGRALQIPRHRIGMDWGQIKAVANDPKRRVILMMGADPRWQPVARAALAAGAVSTLVTDMEFARELLGRSAPRRSQRKK